MWFVKCISLQRSQSNIQFKPSTWGKEKLLPWKVRKKNDASRRKTRVCLSSHIDGLKKKEKRLRASLDIVAGGLRSCDTVNLCSSLPPHSFRSLCSTGGRCCCCGWDFLTATVNLPFIWHRLFNGSPPLQETEAVWAPACLSSVDTWLLISLVNLLGT